MFLSVALCTFNGDKFIQKQIDSILNQSIIVNEIVICDDASDDKTLGILNIYQKKYPTIIKLIKNRISLGTIKNFEKAISLTKGELIFLADQDDIWHKNKVEIMTNFFKENSECKLLFTNGFLIDENGNSMNSTIWDKWKFDKNIRHVWKNNNNAFKDLIINNNKITGATICFHNSLKKYITPIAIPYGYWHDAWFGLHASAQNGLMFIEESLIDYRIHNKQQVGISSEISHEVLTKSNLNCIEKDIFYKKIHKTYPNKYTSIPILNKQKLIYKILKNIYSSLCKVK